MNAADDPKLGGLFGQTRSRFHQEQDHQLPIGNWMLNSKGFQSRSNFQTSLQDNGNNQYYRSVSNNVQPSEVMSKTFQMVMESNQSKFQNKFKLEKLPTKIVKLKPFKQLPDQELMSLADTLKQKRVMREIIDRERAEHQVATYEANPMIRIRPATPKLNLLKMRKQKTAPEMADTKKQEGEYRRKRQQPRLAQLLPLQSLPALPDINTPIPDFSNQVKKRRKKVLEEAKSMALDVDLSSFGDIQNKQPINEDENIMFEREDQQYDDEYDPEDFGGTVTSYAGILSNFQEKFEEIIENEEVEDAIELNEKFLAEHLGVKSEELSRLTKIELRVDTSCHNLQVTGEILSSLEYLRMSDSVIKCFRDIGTSFRFVRILYLARCELKEVQGIQAFINLEELYISHNDIEDLFDIGFLEHLTILDMEGNNVKGIDQLYYLKRCKSLVDVNLISNPVSQVTGYTERLLQCAPLAIQIDDKPRIELSDNIKMDQKASCSAVIKQSDILSRLLKYNKNLLNKAQFEQIQNNIYEIDKDDDDDQIMAQAIKEYTVEKKAQRQFYENFEDEIDTPMSQTPVRKMKVRGCSATSKDRNNTSMFKTTTNSFFKTSTRKSTQMSEQIGQHHESHQSNKSENVVEKAILKIKRRQSESVEEPKIISRYGQENKMKLPKDIFSLINGLNSGVKYQLKEKEGATREKILHNSAADFYQANQSKSTERTSKIDKLLQSSSVSSMHPDDQNVQKPFSFTSHLRTSFGQGFRKEGGPIKAIERIVLRTSDIQFSSSYKSSENVNKTKQI